MGTVDDYLDELDAGRPRGHRTCVRPRARRGARMPSRARDTGCRRSCIAASRCISVMRAQKHIGVYPFSPAAVGGRARSGAGVPKSDVAKGTIRFQPDRAAARRRRARRSWHRARRRSTADAALGGTASARQSRGSTPIAIMTTAMMPSRIRHARGVDSQRPRNRAPNASPKNHTMLAMIAPAANSQRVVAVRVGDGAEEEHGVEVHVRVQPGEGEAREDDRARLGCGAVVGVRDPAERTCAADGCRRCTSWAPSRPALTRSGARPAAPRACRSRRGTRRPPTVRRR